MSPVRITSVKNKVVARFRDAAAGKRPDELVADGVALVDEALDGGLDILELLTSPRLVSSDRGRALRRRLLSGGTPSTDCADGVLEKVSHLTTHQGIAAVVRRPAWSLDKIFAGTALVVIAAGIRDPGNLGAVVRTAEAAGATGLVALAGGADPFRDKAVRGSSGSVFRLPVVAGATPEDVLSALQQAGTRLVVAEGSTGEDYLAADLASSCALVLGGEAGGVPEALREHADARISVPMTEPIDSLNVAVAAGVLLYEARRQRLAPS